MKEVSINGLWFVVKSPSEYIYRDLPSIKIRYMPKVVRRKVIVRSRVKKYTKDKKGRNVRTKAYRIKKIEIREWVLLDGTTKEVFDNLTAACCYLRKALYTYHTEEVEFH